MFCCQHETTIAEGNETREHKVSKNNENNKSKKSKVVKLSWQFDAASNFSWRLQLLSHESHFMYLYVTKSMLQEFDHVASFEWNVVIQSLHLKDSALNTLHF
jgi:hypothetical protein